MNPTKFGLVKRVRNRGFASDCFIFHNSFIAAEKYPKIFLPNVSTNFKANVLNDLDYC